MHRVIIVRKNSPCMRFGIAAVYGVSAVRIIYDVLPRQRRTEKLIDNIRQVCITHNTARRTAVNQWQWRDRTMRPEKTEKKHRHRNWKTYSFTYLYKNQRYPRCGTRTFFTAYGNNTTPLLFKHETTVLRIEHTRMEKSDFWTWPVRFFFTSSNTCSLSFEPSIEVKVVKSQLF